MHASRVACSSPRRTYPPFLERMCYATYRAATKYNFSITWWHSRAPRSGRSADRVDASDVTVGGLTLALSGESANHCGRAALTLSHNRRRQECGVLYWSLWSDFLPPLRLLRSQFKRATRFSRMWTSKRRIRTCVIPESMNIKRATMRHAVTIGMRHGSRQTRTPISGPPTWTVTPLGDRRVQQS